MAVHNQLLAFDRPLVAVRTAGSPREYTAADLVAARSAGYQEGGDAARAFTNQQIVELRAEMQELQQGIFQQLNSAHEELTAHEVMQRWPQSIDKGAEFTMPVAK